MASSLLDMKAMTLCKQQCLHLDSFTNIKFTQFMLHSARMLSESFSKASLESEANID